MPFKKYMKAKIDKRKRLENRYDRREVHRELKQATEQVNHDNDEIITEDTGFTDKG